MALGASPPPPCGQVGYPTRSAPLRLIASARALCHAHRSDGELVDLLGKGRSRAEFERFVSDHGRRLLQTGYLITCDVAEAEDLVQECLLRVARHWPKVRAMAHPEAYARRILINVALDQSRARTRHRHELEEHYCTPMLEHPAETRQMDALEIRDELRQALATLPTRQRTMVVLRYFIDLSEAETAQALNCSLGTVKSTTSRAVERLRVAMSARADAIAASEDNGDDTK